MYILPTNRPSISFYKKTLNPLILQEKRLAFTASRFSSYLMDASRYELAASFLSCLEP
jgi:hypothetical protein